MATETNPDEPSAAADAAAPVAPPKTAKAAKKRPAAKKKPGAKNRRGESKHSKRRIEAVMAQAQALEYRKMGLSYAQIADKLGMAGATTAWNAVESALQRVLLEPADEVRKLELGRLDAMFIPVYANACRGDIAALSSALSIMTRRARLLGLDAPIKTESNNRTDLHSNASTGVLVVGGVMTPEDWAAAAKKQQEDLTRGD